MLSLDQILSSPWALAIGGVVAFFAVDMLIKKQAIAKQRLTSAHPASRGLSFLAEELDGHLDLIEREARRVNIANAVTKLTKPADPK